LADDISQDTWLEVWRSLPTLRASDDRAFGWLAVIARRTICRHFRRASATRETPTPFEGVTARLLPSAPSAEEVAVERVTAAAMLRDPASPLGVAA
ncbi:RNA polymerase sigma factor, partial [Streptomyces daliensis]